MEDIRDDARLSRIAARASTVAAIVKSQSSVRALEDVCEKLQKQLLPMDPGDEGYEDLRTRLCQADDAVKVEMKRQLLEAAGEEGIACELYLRLNGRISTSPSEGWEILTRAVLHILAWIEGAPK